MKYDYLVNLFHIYSSSVYKEVECDFEDLVLNSDLLKLYPVLSIW
jgi:hypothetical protein